MSELKDLNKDITKLYKEARYLRDRSMMCDTDEQAWRIREEQNKKYKKWLFLTNLRAEIMKKGKEK